MWVRACLTDELKPGSMTKFDIFGHTVMVANIGGQFYAMDGICSHGFTDLTRGKLDGFIIECPRHKARFDIRTGKVISGPVGAEGVAHDLHAYPVRVSGDCIDLDLW